MNRSVYVFRFGKYLDANWDREALMNMNGLWDNKVKNKGICNSVNQELNSGLLKRSSVNLSFGPLSDFPHFSVVI